MRKTLITLIASLAIHAAPVGLARLAAVAAPQPRAPQLADPEDRWTGNTAALSGERVYDVNMDPPGAAGAREAPAPAKAPAPAQAPPSPAPPAHAPPAPPAPRLDAPKPPPSTPAAPSANDAPKSTAPEKPATARPPHHRDAPRASAEASAEASPPRTPSPSAPGGEDKSPAASSGGDGRSGSFGAEGPSAPRDLGRAFTRAIPPACQADSSWSKLAPGDAGDLEVTIAIDETGHITGFKPAEGDTPPHLLALVKRTLALLDAGTFALRSGAVSAGKEVLRIRAALSDIDASETGGAAGLSFSYERGKGKAGFTQPGGRRVEVSITVVRVED